jgi:hypothetical protein
VTEEQHIKLAQEALKAYQLEDIPIVGGQLKSSRNPEGIPCKSCGKVKPIKARNMCNACYERQRVALKKGQVKPPDLDEKGNLEDTVLRTMSIAKLSKLNMPPSVLAAIIKKRLDLDWKDVDESSQRNIAQELEEVYEYLRLIGRLDEYLALAASRAVALNTQV